MVNVVVALCVGILVGIIGCKVYGRFHAIGRVRVDNSDPDSSPYLFLELSHTGANDLMKKKFVILQVEVKDFIPHK